MSTAVKTFEKKSIYHSSLVSLAKEGAPVRMMVTSEPRESRYQKPGLSHYCFVKFPDDETEYTLAIEDPTLDDFRKVPKDIWVEARPAGSATQEAYISFNEAKGEPVYDEMGNERVPQGRSEAREAPEPPVAHDPVALAVRQTVEAVEALREAGIEADSIHSIYATHYIQACKR